MTTGLQNSSSALSPAITSLPKLGASSKRSEAGSGAAGGPSFSQVLQQHQASALAPPPAPVIPQAASAADAKPHGTGDQSAARLAERQTSSRQAEAAQQASRDQAAQADQSAQARRDEAKDKDKDAANKSSKDGGASGTNESKPASKTQAASHHHHHHHADKAKDAHAKKAASPEEGDAKKASAKNVAADPAAAATTTTTGPATPGTPTAGAAPDAAQAASGADAAGKAAAHPGSAGAPADNPLAADAGVALGGKHALGAAHGVAGKGGKGGIDPTAAATGKTDAKAAAESASAKNADASSVDAKASALQPQDASFAAAMKSFGADQQPGAQGDTSRQPHEASAAAKIDGAAGIAGLMGAGGTTNTVQQAPEAPPPAQMSFATPTTAPDFAQALGISITSLAQGGVQEAKLHMNPEETGPISIQITLDGTAAQVDFQAANAHTRDAIFAGMPELAAALNAAGLTLTGGGVSEHGRGGQAPGQSQPDTGFGPRAGLGGTEAATPRVSTVVARPSQGAVDLYA